MKALTWIASFFALWLPYLLFEWVAQFVAHDFPADVLTHARGATSLFYFVVTELPILLVPAFVIGGLFAVDLKQSTRTVVAALVALVVTCVCYLPALDELTRYTTMSQIGIALGVYCGVAILFVSVGALARSNRAILGFPIVAIAAACFFITRDVIPTNTPGLLEFGFSLSLSLLAYAYFSTAEYVATSKVLTTLRSAEALLVIATLVATTFQVIKAESWYLSETDLGATQVRIAKTNDTLVAIPVDNPKTVFLENNNYPTTLGDVSEYNILIVAADTVRADELATYGSTLETTKALDKFSKDAWVFERAMSPSSGTFQSISSLFAMVPPSMTPLEVWKRRWMGVVKPGAWAPEIYKAGGVHTFWIGHDFRSYFSAKKIDGFDRGWDHLKRTKEPSRRYAKKADAKTATRAIRHLKELGKSKERFFGFVFFSSPHASYVTRYKDMPKKTQRDKYRQEIRFVDDQFARIERELRRSGLLEKTIVIFTSDHGEAFGEHKSSKHNTTVYNESVHVPLVVRIPKSKPTRVAEPVSLFALIPWLALHDDRDIRRAVHPTVVNDLAPLYDRLGPHALSELLGHRRMVTAIRRNNDTIYIDIGKKTRRRFTDAYELESVTEDDPADMNVVADAYFEVRDARGRFKLTPKKDWVDKKKKKKQKQKQKQKKTKSQLKPTKATPIKPQK